MIETPFSAEAIASDPPRESLSEGEKEARGKEDKERELISYLVQLKQEAVQYRESAYDDLWNIIDEKYYGLKPKLDMEDNEKEYRSNIHMRHAFVQVESMSARVVSSILANRPPVKVSPNPYTNERARRANAIERYITYMLHHKHDPVSLLSGWIKQGERYGLSAMRLRWNYETGYVVNRTPLNDPDTGAFMGFMKSRARTIRCDDPQFKVVNTKMLWWNPAATGPDDLDYIIERYSVRRRKLKELEKRGIYKNVDDIQTRTRDTAIDHEQDHEQIRTGTSKEEVNNENDEILVDLFYFKDRIVEMVDDSIIIRDRDNIHDSGVIPYFFYRAVIVDGDMVGIGSVEPILDLSDESNTKRNQRIDEVNRLIHSQLLVGTTSGFPGGRIAYVPGGIIKVSNVDQIKPMPAQATPVMQEAYLEQDRCDTDIDKVNGNFDVGRGEGSAREATATEVATRVSQGNLRIDLRVQAAMIALARGCEEMYYLARQFTPRNKFVSIMGPDGSNMNITTDELFSGKYEFSYSAGGYLGTRIIEQQTMLTLIQQLLQIPPIAERINAKELVRVVSNVMNKPELEKIINDPVGAMPGINRDPDEENMRFLIGTQVIPVLPGEDNQYHISKHLVIIDDLRTPEPVRKAIAKHIADHSRHQQQDFKALGALGGAMSSQNPGGPGGGMPSGGMPGRMLPGSMMDETMNMANQRGGLTLGGANQPII